MAVVFAMGPPEFVIGFFIFFFIISIVIWLIRWAINKNNNYTVNAGNYMHYRTEPSHPSYYGSPEETKTDRSYNGSPVKDSYSGGNYDKERYNSNGERII